MEQKNAESADCIFCDFVSGKKNAHLVYQDDSHIAFLDKYPIDIGHTLVIPKRHHTLITDMEARDVGELFSQIPKIASAVLEATHADAFSLGQNNGRAANQIIPHVHIHIIPRYSSRGTVWTKRRIVEDSELDALARQIREILDSA